MKLVSVKFMDALPYSGSPLFLSPKQVQRKAHNATYANTKLCPIWIMALPFLDNKKCLSFSDFSFLVFINYIVVVIIIIEIPVLSIIKQLNLLCAYHVWKCTRLPIYNSI